ncbi:hypothetical protein NT6N_37000 [Oceaniferula spumae]|uniref:Prenyltransferase n=1 Tax=Oceaniferula spumae TaxID=2979115 RepID=A0AAT9FRV5_9BACT
MAKHTFGEKFRAVLATGRVANLPTVWSNVIVGFYLAVMLDLTGFGSLIAEYGPHFDHWLLFFVCIATSLLYVGGCMLGDYRDIRFDRENRPGRPLVTGLLSPSFIAVSAIALLTLGLLIGALANTAAVIIGFDVPVSVVKTEYMTLLQPNQLSVLGLLVLFIVIYALFHKKSRAFALGNMALCRTQLVLFAAALGFPVFNTTLLLPLFWLCAPVIIVALSVGVYTLLLASVAATESNQDKIKFSRALKTGMFLLPLIAIGCIAVKDSSLFPLFNELALNSDAFSVTTLRGYFIGTVLIYGSWMIYAFSALPHDKPAFVSRALAGFCLLDACFAASYSVTIPLVCFVFFGLALLLQKIAPAT